MNNVGDLLTLSTQGTSPGSATPIYVWRFWDGSVQATTENYGPVEKVVNIGGVPVPGSAGPYNLPYHCDICDPYGTIVRAIDGAVPANNPPTVTEIKITPNNQAYAFSTKIEVSAYDLEKKAISFYWYDGSTPLTVGVGAVSGPVAMSGTYNGTWIGENRDVYTGTFDTTVYSDGTVLTCKVVDADSGTNLVQLPLQGYSPVAPQFAIAAQPSGLRADASALPDAVIGPNQEIAFSVFATNPADSTAPAFTWFLYGSNGWSTSAAGAYSGITTRQSVGFRNDLIVDISHEAGAGLRKAIVAIANAQTTVYGEQDVMLSANAGPVMSGVRIYKTDGTPVSPTTPIIRPLASADALVPPLLLRFSGTATDANNDIVYYEWTFTSLPDFGNWITYGADVYLDVSDWPSQPYGSLGTVKAIDKYGQPSLSLPIPQIILA